MRVTWLSSGAAIAFGTLSAYLGVQLLRERAGNAALVAQLDQLHVADAVVARADPDVSDRVVPETSTAAAKPRTERPTTSRYDPRRIERELQRDPDYRARMRVRYAASLQGACAGLRNSLGLTAGESDRLINLMVDQRMQMIDAQVATLSGDKKQAVDWDKREKELRHTHEREIRELLGDGQFAQFREYEKTYPARTELQPLVAQLQEAGTPLTDFQWRSLTQAVSAETAVSWSVFTDFSGSSAQYAERAQLAADEYAAATDRLRPTAASILTPEQFARFIALRERELARQQNELQRERAGLNGEASSDGGQR